MFFLFSTIMSNHNNFEVLSCNFKKFLLSRSNDGKVGWFLLPPVLGDPNLLPLLPLVAIRASVCQGLRVTLDNDGKVTQNRIKSKPPALENTSLTERLNVE